MSMSCGKSGENGLTVLSIAVSGYTEASILHRRGGYAAAGACSSLMLLVPPRLTRAEPRRAASLSDSVRVCTGVVGGPVLRYVRRVFAASIA
jgi:hypothetical protein